MPFRSFAQLQPMLALLAGTPEAEVLDLALVDVAPASRPSPSSKLGTPSASSACAAAW